MPATSRPLETAARFAAAFGARPATYAAILSAGISREQLRAAVGRGLILVVRRGHYALPPATALDDDPRRFWPAHEVELRAALADVGSGAFATYDSAALALQLARPSAQAPAAVTLARPGVQDFAGPGLIVRGSDIPAHQVVRVDGIPVTDLRRTSLDLARGRSLPSALIPLDAGMRSWIAMRTGTSQNELRKAVLDPQLREEAHDEWRYVLHSLRGWPGVVAARRALSYADPASESPLESRTRGWFLRAGLPFRIGAPVATSSGHIYWADFLDERSRTVGEADGWTKYGTDAVSVRTALAAEKRRESDLRVDGWRIVRWTSSDPAAAVVDLWRRALRPD